MPYYKLPVADDQEGPYKAPARDRWVDGLGAIYLATLGLAYLASRFKQVILIFFVVFLVTFGLIYYATREKKGYDEFITQGYLRKNYDELAGKRVRVIGQVSRLGKDEIGRTYIVLGDAHDVPEIQDTNNSVCYIGNPAELDSVFRGIEIQVIGTCFGKQTNGAIVLTNSTIFKVGFSKTDRR
jgi:hypothetical protein